MSSTARRRAPLPSTESHDPAEGVVIADTAFREAQRRVADARRALDHVRASPLDYADGKAYAAAIAELEHGLAVAAATANHASAELTKAREDAQAAKLARAEADAPKLREDAEAERAAFLADIEEVGARLAERLALLAAKDAALAANDATLREAGKPRARPDRLSLPADWGGILQATGRASGAEAAFLVAAALTRWNAPEAHASRAAEERERERRKALELEHAARLGQFGAEAREAQIAKDRTAFAAARSDAFLLGARGTPLQAPLEIFRANSGVQA